MTKWIISSRQLCLLLPLLFSCAASAQNATLPVADAVPQDDAHLQKLVDVDATGVTLKELLQKVGGQEVILSASPACAEQKIQAHLKHRPIAAVMRALAQFLPGTWQHVPARHGYKLTMLPRAVLRREEWWKRFEEARQQALNAQRDYLLQAMRGPGRPITYYNMPADAIEARKTDRSFFNQLPALLQEQIARQMNENPFYKSRPTFGTEDREGALAVPLSELPPSVQETAQAYIARRSRQYNLPGNTDNAIVSFSNGGMAVQASLTLADGQWTGTAFQLVPTPMMSSQAAALMLDHTSLANEVHQHRNAVPAEWLALAAFQDSRVWQNALPAKRLYNPTHPRRRSQALQQLADTTDIEFVADYYCKRDFPMKPEAQAAPIARELPEELNDFAAEQDISWKRNEENVTLFRNNRWYRDDYLEAPTPLMLQWMELRYDMDKMNKPNKRSAAAPSKLAVSDTADGDISVTAARVQRYWDWQADVVAKLTPWQIGNGFKYFAPVVPKTPPTSEAVKSRSANLVPFPPADDTPLFSLDADILMNEYKTMLFYATLDAEAKSALIQNKLPFAGLTEAQQARIIPVLPELKALPQAVKARTWIGIDRSEGNGALPGELRLTYHVQ